MDKPIRTCDIAGCDRRHYGRGWCKPHYLKKWSAGQLADGERTLVRRGATLRERLEHIGWDVTASGCWEWRGSKNERGYGQVAVGVYDGKVSRPKLAHRVSYQVFTGTTLGDTVLLHSCDNPPCINPAHLRTGTRLDNARDMSAKRRNPAGEFHAGARLTEAQVGEIRARYATGEVTQRALAAEYGCSQQLVSMLTRGRRRTIPARAGVAHR